ncbi:cysteine hydrolase [Roseovarius sp. TE539]|uniref:cysteine hydrolase family protein n=1 Tax=Roseovarius sp. TE539 TaxID=2249812 RepID=UPI000DDF8554|nr:cysteine hydrolase family protein [Roseovarius sp. TE539]RBI72322.1 cysteine hydrolase [Roseovarius sp. TE539]
MAGLLLIDIQTGFDAPLWGARNNPHAEAQAARLLARWRETDAPVIHVRHLSTEPQSPLSRANGGTDFKPEVLPRSSEPIFEKSVNAAFVGTALEAHLRREGIGKLVVCGLTTPHCVSSTVRMAANLGFLVTLAHDACAAFPENADTSWNRSLSPQSATSVHEAAVSQLHGEFARARSCDHILTAGS